MTRPPGGLRPPENPPDSASENAAANAAANAPQNAPETPQRFRPGDAAACARAIADAAAARRTLRVRGGGTKDHLGELLPVDAVLDTTALSGIVAHVPADLTVTIAAGTRLAELRAALGAAGQFLPLDPPHGHAATIGGVVAANSFGFWRARYGGVRDLLIGTAAALTDGTIARSGGRVVKNVAGYDLNKLFVGSFGTLGVLVECTFKVLPLPTLSAGVRARFARAVDAFAAADAIVRTSARPAALAVAGARAEWEVLLQAQGEAAPVGRTIELLATAAAEHGAAAERDDGVETSLAALREMPAEADGVVVRAALPLAAQPAFANAAARLDGFTAFAADAASGIAYVRALGDDDALVDSADALLAAARVCGGSARIERRPDSLRARLRAWGDVEPAGHFLMRRLKDAFDPAGILEPGRSAVS